MFFLLRNGTKETSSNKTPYYPDKNHAHSSKSAQRFLIHLTCAQRPAPCKNRRNAKIPALEGGRHACCYTLPKRVFCKSIFLQNTLFKKTLFSMDYLEQDKDSDNDALAMLTLLYSAKEVRRAKWQHEQINWEQQHLQKLRHTNGFQK